MLRRPPTQLSLTPYDLSLYDARRAQRIAHTKVERGGRSVSAGVDSNVAPLTRSREHAKHAATIGGAKEPISAEAHDHEESEAAMMPDRDLDDEIPEDDQMGAFSDGGDTVSEEDIDSGDNDSMAGMIARRAGDTRHTPGAGALGPGYSALAASNETHGALFGHDGEDDGEEITMQDDDGDALEDSMLARRRDHGLRRGGSAPSQSRGRATAAQVPSRAAPQRIAAPRQVSGASVPSTTSAAPARSTRAQAQQSQGQPQTRYPSSIPQAQSQGTAAAGTAAVAGSSTSTGIGPSSTQGRAATRERSRRERIMGPAHADTALGSNTSTSSAASARGGATSGASSTRRLR